MTRFFYKHTTAAAFALFIAVSASSCGSPSGSQTAGSEIEEKESHDGGEIILEPADAERFGVKTSVIKPAEFREILTVSGEILPSASGRAIVAAPAAGTVRLASGISEGAAVKAGALVATVQQSGISGGNPDRASRAAVEAAKRELDRLKPLLDEGIVTIREYNAARQAYETAVAAYSPKAESGRATAPISGTVTGIMVREGEFVETGAPVAAISKNESLTLRADIPVRDMDFASSVTSANFRPAGCDSILSIESLGGQLMPGSSSSGEIPGYIPVYFRISNNGAVTPGTSAEVFLIGRKLDDAIAVPAGAIAEAQGVHYVYVKKDEHGYEKRPVKLGNSDGKSVEIKSGLNAGEEVVTENVTFVRLAESSGAVPEGHSHSH